MPPTLFDQAAEPPKTKAEYDSAFEEEVSKLNAAQREAVNQTEGPVLVVAGPGTGKTHLLAARIGHILKTTDAQPYNILCLTYTEAGTIAMRQRLLSFIGPDAYRVNIYTFHGFCNDIIQRNPDYFGNRELEPISELETVELLMQLLDELSADNLLKRKKGDIYYEVPLLQDLFRKMKEESWSTEHITKCIDKYLLGLPEREEYIYKVSNQKRGVEKGDVKQHKIEEETERMAKLREAAILFPKYRKMMLAKNRYDYNDMILWVLNAFKSDENFLLNYQERYLYFLVDEFQDTNGAQNELLNHLIDYWDKPNVFAVGDDDQSIYEFQGARMKNIMDFYLRYEKDIKVVVMEENYRSTQHILDAAKALIDNNASRLVNSIEGLTKTLIASNEDVASSIDPPSIIEYHNTKHEEAAIVDKIEALQQSGVLLNEIAVIYYRHKQAEEIINLIEKKEIPYNVIKRINILELPLIRNLINLLEYLNIEHKTPYGAEDKLFELMHYSFFNISPRDTARIIAHCGRDYKIKIREALGDKSLLKELQLKNENAIIEFENSIATWLAQISNNTLQIIFERIINQAGVLKEIMESPNKVWLMQVLITFFDFIKEESMKNPAITIRSFLETLEKMKTNKIKLEINKTVFEENGVNFTTAHSAKGLEFEHVFLIGCSSDIWEKKGRSYSFKLPDTLTLSNEENLIETARRVFYVAMTRTKQHLQISYPKSNKNGKEIEKALFVAEIQDKTGLNTSEEHLSSERLTQLSMEALQETKLPDAELVDKEFINALLEKYSMSVTHLNKYLNCPVAFYYENILRVPAAKNDSMAFGSAVHFALKRLFDKMRESGKGIFSSKEVFVKAFLWEIDRNRASFSVQQYERRKELGEEALPAYYDKYINEWNKIVVSEYNIDNIEMDGIPINGKIDKIEFDGHDANVVDYKTGKVENGRKKLKPPDDKDPLGGDYWRQIVFYKILMDEIRPKKWTMVSGEIDFIEKDEKKAKDFVKVKVAVSREDIIFVKEQIRDTWKKIMDHQFSDGCSKEDCHWCDFVKNQYMSDELAPANEDYAN